MNLFISVTLVASSFGLLVCVVGLVRTLVKYSRFKSEELALNQASTTYSPINTAASNGITAQQHAADIKPADSTKRSQARSHPQVAPPARHRSIA